MTRFVRTDRAPGTGLRATLLGVLDQINERLADLTDDAASGRRSRRVAARAVLPVTVRFVDHAERPVTLEAALCNISSTGVAVVHRTFVHAGLPCTVVLAHGGRSLQLEGRVARCVYVDRFVHLIGIAFERRLDLSGVKDEPAIARAADLGVTIDDNARLTWETGLELIDRVDRVDELVRAGASTRDLRSALEELRAALTVTVRAMDPAAGEVTDDRESAAPRSDPPASPRP